MIQRFVATSVALCAYAASAQVPDSATLAGMSWRSIGPVNMAGRITDVEVDPRNPKVFYVAGATGGLWKTVNAGTSFIPLWENGPIASLGDIAISPSNPDIIWLGTGEDDSRNSVQPGYGIYKSIDGGVTWQSMGLQRTQHIGRIIVHPTNPDIVWVSALGALGLQPGTGTLQDHGRRPDVDAEQVYQRQGGVHRPRDRSAQPERVVRLQLRARARPVFPQERRPGVGTLAHRRRRDDVA